MSLFIVQTGPRYGGIVLYATRQLNRRNMFELQGSRALAARFETRTRAELAAKRFSSIYDLVVAEVPS